MTMTWKKAKSFSVSKKLYTLHSCIMSTKNTTYRVDLQFFHSYARLCLP